MEADDNKWFLNEIKGHSWPIFMACLTVFVSNSLQIFTSLFVMVVYNKVIPNSAMNTLVALAVVWVCSSCSTIYSRLSKLVLWMTFALE